MPETQLTSFPVLSVYPRFEISLSASESDVRFNLTVSVHPLVPTSSSVYLFSFLSMCPVELSSLSQENTFETWSKLLFPLEFGIISYGCLGLSVNNLISAMVLVQDPVGIWCRNDVVLTSMRRNHVASTLIRRHFYVMCPLGMFSNIQWWSVFRTCLYVIIASTFSSHSSNGGRN